MVPTYSIDEFKSHFRMTRGAMDILGREVAATGIIPQGNHFGRPPIPVQCRVLAFVWFMSNSKVMRSVLDRFDLTLSSLFRKFGYCGPGTGKDYQGDAIEHEKPVGHSNRGNRTTF